MFSFTWAAIGVLAYLLWLTWKRLKDAETKLAVKISFGNEWLLLKAVIAIDYEAFKLLLGEDGLPDSFKFPWVRLHYKLNASAEFMDDIRENDSLLPDSVDYDELVKESNRLMNELKN